MRCLVLLLFSSLAYAASVQPHYTIEKNPLKCAGRLAGWAVADLGYKGKMNFWIRQSSPADEFTLFGDFTGGDQVKQKMLGRIGIVSYPVFDEENNQIGVGCTYKNEDRLQFHLRIGVGAGSTLIHRPDYDQLEGEVKCLMISGLKHDHNGAFKNYNPYVQNDSLKLASMQCQIVDSWSEAKRVLNRQIANPEAPRIRKILFMEAAHGAEGGLIGSNDAEEDGGSILKILNHFSRKYKVTAVMNSCFSGDMIGRKLGFDRKFPADPAVKNLCMMTSSTFANSSTNQTPKLDVPYQLNQADLKNLNGLDLFNSLYNMAMISSSPWEEAGVVSQLSKNISVKKQSVSEECTDLLVDMRMITFEYEHSGKINLVGEEYQNFIKHLKYNKCSNSPEVPKAYIEMLAFYPEKLKQPEGMRIILDAITWSDAEFTYGGPPFTLTSRLWSKGTLTTARNISLDRTRYEACALW